MPWEPVASQEHLVDVRTTKARIVVFVTAPANCYLCKLVEPKIRTFADDLDFSDIAFYSLDVDRVSIEHDPQLSAVSTLPVFLLYARGSLREIVPVTREQRPGRLLARAIKKTFPLVEDG